MGTSTEELSYQEEQIARTRQDLSRDVDALQDKVSPSAIMDRRKTAVRSRWASMKNSVMGSGQSATSGVGGMAGNVSSTASDAGSAIEDRVEGSPLAAGLVAFGAGLVIGGLIPASKAEAQGVQRLKEAAQEHAQPVIDEAKSAAQEVGQNLKDKASEAADEVKSSAQDSAQRVKDEAPTGSTESSDSTSSYPTPPSTY